MRPLPKEAVKANPARPGMSSVNAIYITERLNEVFGVGGWSFTVSEGEGTPFTQTTKNGDRAMYKGLIKGRLELSNGAVYEAVASSDNSDEGDALKGAGTDALTKCCSWLGIASYVWKNQTHDVATAEWAAKWKKYNESLQEPAASKKIADSTHSNDLPTTPAPPATTTLSAFERKLAKYASLADMFDAMTAKLSAIDLHTWNTAFESAEKQNKSAVAESLFEQLTRK